LKETIEFAYKFIIIIYYDDDGGGSCSFRISQILMALPLGCFH
jgi:hypothetical protein